MTAAWDAEVLKSFGLGSGQGDVRKRACIRSIALKVKMLPQVTKLCCSEISHEALGAGMSTYGSTAQN